MTAKADLLRVLQDVSRSEEAIRADCLSIARRRKMSTEAITRVGTEVGVALRTTRKPVNVEEAITHLVRERLKATKSTEGTAIDPTQDVSTCSTVEQEENDEDTVSPSATLVHTPDVVAMIHTLTAHISELQTELADLKAMFISERAEARDREQRQKNKITQLEKILNTHVESIDKTNDMACTMLKSIDAKTTTVISDLKKAGSAVRSENTSTPGNYYGQHVYARQQRRPAGLGRCGQKTHRIGFTQTKIAAWPFQGAHDGQPPTAEYKRRRQR